jgi:hypothetical protein
MRIIGIAVAMVVTASVTMAFAQDVTSPSGSASAYDKKGTQTIPPAGRATTGQSNPSGSGNSTSGGNDYNDDQGRDAMQKPDSAPANTGQQRQK